MILHAVFHLFVDFCENDYTIERLKKWEDGNFSEEEPNSIASLIKQRKWAMEVLEIYNWVKLRQQYLYPVESIKDADLAAWYIVDEDVITAKETEMLHKIIELRSSLWI